MEMSGIPFGTTDWGARLADRTGARLVTFSGCSHWWPLDPTTSPGSFARTGPEAARAITCRVRS
jgi:hypothetical protein